MHHSMPWARALLAAVLGLAAVNLQAQTSSVCQKSNCKYLDPALTPEARATDLVARMTLEEKAAQLGHTAPAIPRLGVPEYNWWNEGLHGVARAGIATVFPQAIGMAASWDDHLMQDVGNVISTEFRAKYVEHVHRDGGTDWYRGLTVWSPNINIFRDPRWGRGQETYGEDPHLTARMGIGFIKGLQGDDPKFFKTIATSKHFAVHSGPESNRHREDVYPTPHDLEDTYLPAFRATVTEAKVQSVMCVYNAVNGVPGCANDELMDKYLRKSWGFSGYVVSDCGAAANIYREDSLHYAKTPEQGVALGFKAGMDLICGDYRNNMTTDVQPIINSVKQGLLPQTVVDRALTRLFVGRIRLGMFDDPKTLPFAAIKATDYDTPQHHEMALAMAKKSLVLLKNDGVLPLKQAPKSIAVIGPNADSYDALVGNYYGKPSKTATVLDGIRARFPNSKIEYAEGSGLVGPAEPAVPDSAVCLDAACKNPGLKFEQFAGVKLEGDATKSRTDKNARFDWQGDELATSTRWTGYIKAPKSGDYQFRFSSEGGYRVWVGDKLVVDEWGVGDAPSILAGTTTLQAGKVYPLKVEAFQIGPRGNQKLLWSLPGDTGQEAIAAAKRAELVIFVGGLSARVEGEEMKIQAAGFAGGDRTSLDLPAPQQALLEKLQATGKPVVLVLMNGSALSINWAAKKIPAIIEAWYPGGEGGNAVAELLAGDFSPAGRLPVTFYKSAEQLPAFGDYSMNGRTYRYFKGEALYPFGYGLSYTSFTYAKPRLSAGNIKAGDQVTATIDVTNAGQRDSDEVVQLYLAKPGDSANPVLAGFSRVFIKAGQTQSVNFTLDARALSLVDDKGIRKVVPGDYTIHLGGGQPAYAKNQSATLVVAGSIELPK